VRVEIIALALGPGLRDQTELALALSRIGATRTLDVLDLASREIDVDVEELADALRRRIVRAQMELR
jgi:hypothetical protein